MIIYGVPCVSSFLWLVFHLSCGFKFEHNLLTSVCEPTMTPHDSASTSIKAKAVAHLEPFSWDVPVGQWVSGSCRPVTEGLGRQYWNTGLAMLGGFWRSPSFSKSTYE